MHLTTTTRREKPNGAGERAFDRPCAPAFAACRRAGFLLMSRGRSSVFAAICLAAMLLAGCGGKPFNVKTQVALPAIADAPVAESPGVRLQAAVIRNEDLLLETFDANLILAGV